MVRDKWQVTEGSLQQELWALSSATCKEMNAANNHLSLVADTKMSLR